MPIQHIIYVLKTAFRGPVRTPLGRWNVDNHKQTMLKIKYANEDHCGSCGDNNTSNTKSSNYNEGDPFVENDDVYVYMMGVETVPSGNYTIKSK